MLFWATYEAAGVFSNWCAGTAGIGVRRFTSALWNFDSLELAKPNVNKDAQSRAPVPLS